MNCINRTFDMNNAEKRVTMHPLLKRIISFVTAVCMGLLVLPPFPVTAAPVSEVLVSEGTCPHEWDTETLSTASTCTTYGEWIYWCR